MIKIQIKLDDQKKKKTKRRDSIGSGNLIFQELGVQAWLDTGAQMVATGVAWFCFPLWWLHSLAGSVHLIAKMTSRSPCWVVLRTHIGERTLRFHRFIKWECFWLPVTEYPN